MLFSVVVRSETTKQSPTQRDCHAYYRSLAMTQDNPAASLVYLSVVLRCYIEEFKSLGYTKRIRYEQDKAKRVPRQARTPVRN